ncbi:unnamed protein product [Lampetra planeri]
MPAARGSEFPNATAMQTPPTALPLRGFNGGSARRGKLHDLASECSCGGSNHNISLVTSHIDRSIHLRAAVATRYAWLPVAHVGDDDDHHDDDDDEEEDESEGLCRRRGHYRVLARRLNAQRSSGRPLCDVSLRMGGHVAHAHRGLLAAVSPYFRAMFAGTAREVLLLSDFFSLPLLHSVAAEFLRARGLDASITGYSSIAWLATATDTANETDTCSAAFTDERSIS